MIAAEWKKILIKQTGIVIIIILLILKVIFTLTNGYESHYVINQNQEGYSFYLNQYKGKLTDIKEREIKAEYYAVGHAAGELEELFRQWKEKKIDKTQYESLCKKYFERQKNTAVFNAVYNQYCYVVRAPNERYIMDGRGWITLLSNDKPDLLLLLCLIILLTPLFCNEYESGMDALLLSSVSKYRTGIYKLMTGVFLAVGTTVIFSIIEFICINSIVGLNDGGFPLQSLEFFHNSDYHISLNQAFMLVVLFRMSGAMLLVACISTIGVLCKKSIITLFWGSIITFLPYVFLKGNSLLYYLPSPAGLLSGVGYLWGSSYTTMQDQYGNTVNMIQFQKIDKERLGFILTGYGIETVLLLLLCLKKYSGYTFKFQNLRHKIICCICILVVSSPFFTGCEMSVKNNDNFLVNTLESINYGETNKYKVYYDITNGSVRAEDKTTGEIIDLIRHPFEQDTEINAIFVHNEHCYYLSRIPYVEGIRVYEINMKNFGQKLIFNNVKEINDEFYGIVFKESNTINDFNEDLKTSLPVFCFFINNNYIYYGVNSQLIQINRRTGKEITIAMDVEDWKSLFYCNRNIYYVDKQHQLGIFNEEDGEVNKVDSVYTEQFSIKGDLIEYNDLLDNNELHYYMMEK